MAKQRQVRIEQGLPPALMEQMQDRTDDQLEAETKYRSIALSILGSRAAERYDAEATRTYFRRALAASRPQERPQIRRMANASLALAEHRAGDLKVAVEKLGHEAPPKRALMGLRLMGLIAPPKGAPTIRRVRGIAIVAAIVLVLLLLGLGLVELISLPFGGGLGLPAGILLGLLLVAAVLSGLAIFGRRRQKAAQAKAKAARARPSAAATSPATARRSRGAQAKPAGPAGKSASVAAGRGLLAAARSRRGKPAATTGDTAKTTGQAHTKATGQARTKATGQAQTKATGQAQTKATGQAQTKATGQARAKATGRGRSAPAAKPTAQGRSTPAAKPAGQGRATPAAKPTGQARPEQTAPGAKPAGQSKPGGGQAGGGKPAGGQSSKPGRRTRGSGPAK